MWTCVTLCVCYWAVRGRYWMVRGTWRPAAPDSGVGRRSSSSSSSSSRSGRSPLPSSSSVSLSMSSLSSGAHRAVRKCFHFDFRGNFNFLIFALISATSGNVLGSPRWGVYSAPPTHPPQTPPPTPSCLLRCLRQLHDFHSTTRIKNNNYVLSHEYTHSYTPAGHKVHQSSKRHLKHFLPGCPRPTHF